MFKVNPKFWDWLDNAPLDVHLTLGIILVLVIFSIYGLVYSLCYISGQCSREEEQEEIRRSIQERKND